MTSILIVEGHDEVALVNKLCETHNFSSIEVINAKSNGNIKKAFMAALVGSNVTRVAILCDAEENPIGREKMLEECAVDVAQSPSPNIDYEYLILPNASATGSLETLCLQLLAEDDSLMRCTNEFIDCIDASQPKTHKLSTQARKDKARFLIRHYAATGSPQGFKSLLDDKQIDLTAPIFEPIVALLKRLSDKQTL